MDWKEKRWRADELVAVLGTPAGRSSQAWYPADGSAFTRRTMLVWQCSAAAETASGELDEDRSWCLATNDYAYEASEGDPDGWRLAACDRHARELSAQ